MYDFDVSGDNFEFVPFPDVLEDMLLLNESVSDNDVLLSDVSHNDLPVYIYTDVSSNDYSASIEVISGQLEQIEKDINIFFGVYMLTRNNLDTSRIIVWRNIGVDVDG